MKTDLSVARLRELLHYDPETGVFTRLKAVGKFQPGSQAGTVSRDGYIQIQIDGVLYYAHRLAWLYTFKKWPNGKLDHRDTIKAHNKISNLREATSQQNAQNCGLRSDNKSGFTWVYWIEEKGKYQSRIKANGRTLSLGYFVTLEEAVSARKQAEIEYFGEFRRSA